MGSINQTSHHATLGKQQQQFMMVSFILQLLQIFVSLAAAAFAAPQIVPYVHQEIEAEPYVHIEPEISPLALGIVRPNAAPAAPQQFAAPAQQQFVPNSNLLPLF